MDPVRTLSRGERALGLRTPSRSTLGGARTQVRARTTRERGRAGAWATLGVRARGFAGARPPASAPGRVLLSSRGGKIYTRTQQHTHTQHTHRHRRLWDWIDYLSIFRVKNEVSVAKIESMMMMIVYCTYSVTTAKEKRRQRSGRNIGT